MGLCVMGVVGSVSVVGLELWVIVTVCAPRASVDVSVLAVFGFRASRSFKTLGALSSGAWCLVVSLI